jgi:pimeloyl-ACP methyl ester carboxylesterase
MLDERSDLREGYAEIGDARLHYVEAGDGPLIVLLHGFPDFWCRAETTHFLSLSFSNPPHQLRRSS